MMADQNSSMPSFYNGGFVTPLRHDLVDVHIALIDKISNEIRELSDNEPDPYYDEIIGAKIAELKELHNQLEVYEKVMSRVVKDSDLWERESYRFSNRLPAFGKRCEIDDFVESFESDNRFLIIQGQTGSGKSTQIPQYIADHPRMSGKKVICTQPRKLAAIALAERVSLEYACGKKNSKVGAQVGYSVGGSESKISMKKTRIEFMTEGRMLERLRKRREDDFANIGAIIIDEAHERSIVCDILLGTLKKDDPLWNDILIVVASATIDLRVLNSYFENRAKIIEISGRMYPVQRFYKPLPEIQQGKTDNLGENGDIIKAVAETALDIHQSRESESGDILCFLPGADEVHKAAVWFEKNVKPESMLLTHRIYELSGRQEAEEQREVFEELNPRKCRKIIFASPIAETSITINGVVYVVDSGYRKEMTYDPKRNIYSRQTVLISQSSSIQREGRAGRTQPGFCYKLYSEADFLNMNINTLPEIFRRPLPLAIIYLRTMNIDPATFDWISAPDPETVKSAEEELIYLGALEATSMRPTELGELISYSQQDPKVVRMIYTGMKKGAGMAAVKIAALLSVSKFFFYSGGKDADQKTKTQLLEKRKPLLEKDGDLLTMYKLYSKYESLADEKRCRKMSKTQLEWIQDNDLCKKAFLTADLNVNDLKYTFSQSKFWSQAESQESDVSDDDMLRLFCSGYFLQAAQRVIIRDNRLTYFAFEPEVLGNLPFKASLVQTSNIALNGEANGENDGIPDWIIYDQILKYPDTTVFPLSSRIEPEWIWTENETFYNQCIKKQDKLPTEIIEFNESQWVLLSLLGWRLMYLPYFENQLNCSLVVNLYLGSLRAFCSKSSVICVQLFFEREINHIKNEICNERFEQPWPQDTRLVIGPGYEVASILLSGEFDVIYVRNLDRSCTYEQFENLILSNMEKEKVLSIRLILQATASMGIVRLATSDDAVSLFNYLQCMKKFDADFADVEVTPCFGKNSNINSRAIPRAEESKIKISWSLGPSKGKAFLLLDSAEEGNEVVDLLPIWFLGAVANAVGDVESKKNRNCYCRKRWRCRWCKRAGNSSRSNSKSKNPKVRRVAAKIGFQMAYKFIESAIYEFKPIYKIEVIDLPLHVDEYEIIDKLRKHSGITPSKVVVERFPDNDIQLSPEEIEAKLAPFRSVFGTGKFSVSEIFEETSHRAGLFISSPNGDALTLVEDDIKSVYEKKLEYFQPHRVHLERLVTFTVPADVYERLNFKFQDVLRQMRKWEVWVNESAPATGKKNSGKTEEIPRFVYISFRHADYVIMKRCRQLLDKVVERSILTAKEIPKIENIFTCTGRLMVTRMANLYRECCIRLDSRNLQIYIYGAKSEDREDIVKKLDVIVQFIGKWKQAGFFEKVIDLDRDALENVQSLNPDFVDSIFKKFDFIEGQGRLIGKNKLILSLVNEVEFQEVKNYLEEKGLMMPKWKKAQFSVRDCGLCFCEVDSNFVVMSLCNHAFCMDCIKHMFASVAEGTGVPVRCPANECGVLLPVQDIKKVVPLEAIPKLNETALNMYLRKENGLGYRYRYCPQPDCNVVFRSSIHLEGPSFYKCDYCCNNFCLDCTEFFGKEFKDHPNQTCEYVRELEFNLIRKLTNTIRNDILCLNCPLCKAVYDDYDGCGALTCSNQQCGAKFCALCLEDCKKDAHPHVKICRYNNTRGNIYVTKDNVNKANRLYRIDKLSKFFKNSSEFQRSPIPNLASKVLKEVLCDLNDHGINVTDIKHVKLSDEVEEEMCRNLMNLIRNEILTLCCPGCKTAFYNFDGDAVITCITCEASFCALCLESKTVDIHICRYNDNSETNSSNIDRNLIDSGNRRYRIDKLSEFFRNSPDLQTSSVSDLKSKLLSALTGDLSNLGIFATDIQSL